MLPTPPQQPQISVFSVLENKIVSYISETRAQLADIGCPTANIIEIFSRYLSKQSERQAVLMQALSALNNALDQEDPTEGMKAFEKEISSYTESYVDFLSTVTAELIKVLKCVRKKDPKDTEIIKKRLVILKQLLSTSLKIYDKMFVKHVKNINKLNEEIDKVLEKSTCVVM